MDRKSIYDAAERVLITARLAPIFHGAPPPELADSVDVCDGHWYPPCRCATGCEQAHEELGAECWCHAPRVRFEVRNGKAVPISASPVPLEIVDAVNAMLFTISPRCPEIEANIDLIAAAPELLAALELIVDHFGDPLKVAKSAIAKARGSASHGASDMCGGGINAEKETGY